MQRGQAVRPAHLGTRGDANRTQPTRGVAACEGSLPAPGPQGAQPPPEDPRAVVPVPGGSLEALIRGGPAGGPCCPKHGRFQSSFTGFEES